MWREEPTYQRPYQPACESDAGIIKGNTGRHLLLKTDRTSHTGSLQTVTTVNTWYMGLFHIHVCWLGLTRNIGPERYMDLASPLHQRYQLEGDALVLFLLLSFDYEAAKHASAAWNSWKGTWRNGRINQIWLKTYAKTRVLLWRYKPGWRGRNKLASVRRRHCTRLARRLQSHSGDGPFGTHLSTSRHT